MSPAVNGSEHARYEDELALELDGAIEITDVPPSPSTRLANGVLLAAAVVVTALNLRPSVTSVAPLLGEMRTELGVSSVWAGILTTLPVLCFSAAGATAPLLAKRLGLGRTVTVALLVLAAGLAIRPYGDGGLMLGATLLASSGIALANVLIPVVIKSSFPARIGLMTGIYTSALQAGGAFGAAVTPAMEHSVGGWRPSLAIWAALALAALLLWLPAARQHRADWATTAAKTTARRSLLRSPLAWTVTLYMGSQSFLAYIMMGWLPQIFIDNGMDKTTAGVMSGVMSLVGVPIALLISPLAARSTHQSLWNVGLGVLGVSGAIGLLVAPSAAPVLWSMLVGIGMSAFSLALTVIALRARNAEDTAQLSGMAQGFGYLLASTGPFLFGLLHDVSGGWHVPFVLFFSVYAVQLTAGWFAGRNRNV
ncbi:MFS transporter [Mycobacterium sp. CBMA293]|uniref:CynX/NimT family MFS transporter n=1 Tax=unclassified Mycolicibacterium TaxID=2636767 RepID=UPI0012DCABF6|nr:MULTISPECIES: MFS transporter [unclassified Mycolicibacterium]MUL44656.1 MFS transporter [Mycolicibacterium sp. CBMA 360]MUL59980.1 MFS transporter [Mycolicibacterium sp. CBMA 335]MUL68823.1 MFS transporter [Mycolicibacterium sp. CBMA 311]MUL93786.1 MFS transporter [Mycolicibacterium sp. CBMA 230]MUM06029.1 MFS transporter [Mycolicibacterium sp. CBMA 213]